MIASQICYVSPYPALTALLHECLDETTSPPEVVEAPLADAETAAHIARERGIEVLVTTENNARYLRTRVALPIVIISFSAFDTVYALRRAAREHGQPIALFQFLYHTPLMPAFREIIECDIKEFVFKDKDDGRTKLAQAKREGFRAVVGGGLIYAMAQDLGCERILLIPEKEAILHSYEQAKQIVVARHDERRRALVFRCVVDNSFDGIVAVDKETRITVFNRAAANMLQVPTHEAIGRLVHEVLPQNLLPPVMESGTAELDQLKVYSQKSLLINAVPIYEGKQIVEAIFTLQETKRIESLEEKVRRTNRSTDFAARMTFQDIIAVSSAMRKVINDANLFARSSETILITGETGTGKELFAQSIHNASARGPHPFVGVNCAAIPPSLLESELFGYSEGSFTGAKHGGKKGLFELAHGGTIFLDEVGEIPQDAQLRLLRVLQERQVRRVGDTKVTPIDVRVIAATNQYLEKRLKDGQLRSDLYYRLNVLQLRIPSLRERTDDILPLISAFLDQFCFSTKLKLILESSINKYQQFVLSHSWPGNVRELQNLVKRVCVLSEAGTDDSIESIVKSVFERTFEGQKVNDQAAPQVPFLSLKGNLHNSEGDLIARLYEQVNYNKSELAKVLGIGRTTLWRKLNKFGLK